MFLKKDMLLFHSQEQWIFSLRFGSVVNTKQLTFFKFNSFSLVQESLSIRLFFEITNWSITNTFVSCR
jgi:hypothetical protein